MTRASAFLTICLATIICTLQAQSIRLEKNNTEPVNVYASFENIMGIKTLRVVKDSAVEKNDEPTFVKIRGIKFKNGTIEVKVLSRSESTGEVGFWVETGTEGFFSELKI